jgi:predicted amidohydrolase YtcJ
MFRRFVPLVALLAAAAPLTAAEADLILHNGKVVTVDAKFAVRQAVAVKDGRILSVGTDDAVMKAKGERTQVIDLGGKTVLPGLID